MQKQPTLKLGHQQDPPATRDASKMAKNSQSGYKSKSKSKLKLKSTRKPLREVVNGVRIKPSASLNQPTQNKNNNTNNNIINKNQNEEERKGDESLDRLVLIHSDLSSLLHQIDDLVGKAIRHKATSKNDTKEIESFAQVLSEMQNSLKPWVPKFQQSISSSSLESNSQLEKSLASKTVDVAADDDKSNVVGSPAQSNWDLLVSPSPLVSWRAGCTDEVGRQLFLLTPLPKGAISKLRGPSKPAIETSRKNTNTDVGRAPPPPFVLSENLKNDLVDCVAAKPTPNQVPDCSVTSTETTKKDKFESPEKLSKIVCSKVAMTPCREVSPPKSCILLEPISEFTQKKVRGVRASTPFPSGLHKFSDSDDDSDISSGEASEHLISNYPELVGIKLAHEFGNGRKIVEASPVWCMSPPKTCIVMEPPEDKMLNTTTSLQFPTTACSPCGKIKKESEYQGLGQGLAAIEFTPSWKELGSTVQTGKRRPGENTLKKELWTRFEAATSKGLRLGEPVCQPGANKGFLDLLEEASSVQEMQ